MPARRGERVAPPGPPDGWELRYATNEAAKGWDQLCATARSNTWEAWIVLTTRPTEPENRARQHPMKGQLGSRDVRGKILEQWQYEVTAGGRIWYCPEPDRRIVWLVAASTGHPKATE